MTKVKCTVDSCEYWGKNQVCTAEQIWVRNDISGDPDQFNNHFINAAKMEFSKELNETGSNESPNDLQTSAQTSPQTCCDTMRLKNVK